MYGQEWVDRVSAVIQVLRLLGLSVGLPSGWLAAHREQHHPPGGLRAAEEIEVMRLVGASRLHILPRSCLKHDPGNAGAGLAFAVAFRRVSRHVMADPVTPGQIFGMEWGVSRTALGRRDGPGGRRRRRIRQRGFGGRFLRA